MRMVVKPFWSSPPAGPIAWSSSLAFGIAPAQSARGLAHSKTRRAVRGPSGFAIASWSAAALRRFPHSLPPVAESPLAHDLTHLLAI